MRYFRCGFICFMFGAVQFLIVLILTFLCLRFVWFSKDGWVATCLGKSCWLGLSPVILLSVGMCLSIFPFDISDNFGFCWGWSGGAMVLGKLPVPGRPTIWITVGQWPTALAVGADGFFFGHFYSHLSFLLFLPLFGRRPDIYWSTVSKGY